MIRAQLVYLWIPALMLVACGGDGGSVGSSKFCYDIQNLPGDADDYTV